MALKNYTTTVSALKSIGEIQASLVEHGASSIMVDYSSGKEPESISFLIDNARGKLSFRLPANVAKVEQILLGQRARKPNTYDTGYKETMARIHKQASMTAWRTIRDWVLAQMAIIETEMVSLEQVFLPYLMVDKETTLYESIQQRGFLLKAGEKE